MEDILKEILKFKTFNKLKSVYRQNSVEDRKESAAEHTWSCLVLADYFISKYSLKLNRLKVYELLMYHDVVEIEAGDTPLLPNKKGNKNFNQYEKEEKAKLILTSSLPSPLNEKFKSLFTEFQEQKTEEAKFAKAIDSLDAIIQELDYKEDWKGWSKEFLISKKLRYFENFPELKRIFLELVDYLEEKNYFK